MQTSIEGTKKALTGQSNLVILEFIVAPGPLTAQRNICIADRSALLGRGNTALPVSARTVAELQQPTTRPVRVGKGGRSGFIHFAPLFFCPREDSMPIQKPELVAFKVSPALALQLQELCRQTGRKRSEVMRALLATATLEDLPSHWSGPDAQLLAEVES